MRRPPTPWSVIYLFLWTAVSTVCVTSGETSFCPTGCKCGPVKDPWTHKTEFTIGCSNVTLTDVMEFHGGEKVGVLDLTGHTISVLKNRAFKGVIPKRILLGKNNISIIEPDAFVDVAGVTEEVDLSSNSLVVLPQGLGKLASLRTLELAGNVHLKLQNGSFRGLTSLETLGLDDCYLDEIPAGTFADIAGTLRKLLLFFNNLKSIPGAVKQLRNLEEVDFDSNPISFVPANAFRGMKKLKKVILSRNDFINPDSIHPLAFIDVAATLEDLNFFHSSLTECPVEALSPLKQLKTLSFNANNIREFPPGAFQTLDSLTELTLDENEFTLSREMFAGVTDTVTMLSIRRMRFTKLPVHELAILDHLQWLDASENDFTKLDDNFTTGVMANRYTLNWMKISEISPLAFSGKKHPVHLSLSDNRVETLGFVTDPCVFDYIDVSENPLVCDCHTLFVALHSDVQLEGTCRQSDVYVGMDVSGETFRSAAKAKCPDVKYGDVKVCNRRHTYHHFSRSGTLQYSTILFTCTLFTVTVLLFSPTWLL